MKAAFHTLGCKVNHYETEAIKEAFVSRGAEIAEEDGFADVYVINTCTVTNIADRKSRQFIRRAKKINPEALIVVTGCYAQVAAEELADMPEVDLIIGNGRKSEICGLVMQKLSGVSEALKAGDSEGAGAASDPGPNAAPGRCGGAGRAGRAEIKVLPRGELTYYEDMGEIASGSDGMARAYIKIQDGCDRFCSYCLIPYARGPVRSRPAEQILSEIAALHKKGYREFVLTGINTALYGTEAGSECSLSELLSEIDRMEVPDQDEFRIRLSSLEPTVVDKDNVEEIIRHRRLCHHLHLSAQSGSSAVLRAMNRRYTREEYLDIVNAIREYDPLYGITTDIIVGFPGESEADFDGSMDIVEKACFGRTHIFRYSPRRGTVGAALKDPVPEQVKKIRSEALEEKASEASERFIRANLGIAHTVLIEEISEGYAQGYTGNYIKTYIRCSEDELPAEGSIISVRLTEAFRDGALAEADAQA